MLRACLSFTLPLTAAAEAYGSILPACPAVRVCVAAEQLPTKHAQAPQDDAAGVSGSASEEPSAAAAAERPGRADQTPVSSSQSARDTLRASADEPRAPPESPPVAFDGSAPSTLPSPSAKTLERVLTRARLRQMSGGGGSGSPGARSAGPFQVRQHSNALEMAMFVADRHLASSSAAAARLDSLLKPPDMALATSSSPATSADSRLAATNQPTLTLSPRPSGR